MSRVLIAGCGYIGTRLALRLRDLGHEVVALRRRAFELEGIETLAADITETSKLRLPGVDVAFFTAAPDSRDESAYRAVYVDGLREVSSSLDTGTRLIFVSSTAVYGQDDGSVVDESSPTVPRNFRGRVLLEAEAMARVTLRLGGLYGPGRTRALEEVRSGRARFSSGRFLNLIHRDDACGALEHVMSLPEPEWVYLGIDTEPVESESFYRWLAGQDGQSPPLPAAGGGNAHDLGKRCSSALLRASGYVFEYPTYRHGYGELMKRRIFEPCPDKANCVSSTGARAKHRLVPWRFAGSAADVQRALAGALAEIGGHIVVSEADYLRAEFSSRVFGFVDDVELAVNAASKTIDFRSASRTGYSDLGVNRRRMRKLWRRLVDERKILAVPTFE
jgi:uncharacterized protein (DUF1499 family)/uncharacterized protein YbjT (DUF2867 family)